MDPKSLKRKISRIFNAEKKAKVVLLANTGSKDPNFTYMTDFEGGLYEDSFLVIEKAGETVFTDMREYEGAKRQIIRGMRIVELKDKKSVDKLIKMAKGKTVGINGDFLPYRRYRSIMKRWKPRKVIDVTEALSKAREVKEPYELERMRKAVKITKAAIAKTQRSLRIGISEKEAANYFNGLIVEMGAEGNAFESIVCFGANAAVPHHSPDNTKLRYGDFVLIDVGAKYKNYCADITRTVIFGNDRKRIKDYQRKMEIINTVNEAQRLAIKAIKEGAKGDRIHMITQNYIDRAAKGRYKGTFGHALGHSIGVEVHDGIGRFLSPKSDLILKEGMVSSVEPGIYVPGFGGARKEDDIVVTKKGCEIL